ncbi:hypothetical protein L915_03325 [Phytophthora nicotianae]|uniref:Uncharacterized protein n=1 Tax=Phytophthora nicotianae TaxID=4792 RepID=W2HGB8_PHYNI|nr:hypothetical protein L915_03325 [Phytophthora nicotianae]
MVTTAMPTKSRLDAHRNDKVMNTLRWVQSVPGAEGDASTTVTGETETVSDFKCRDSDSSASYIATSEREGTTTGREDVQGSVRVEYQVGRGSDDRAGQDLRIGSPSVDDRRKLVGGDPGMDHNEHQDNKVGLEDYAKDLAFLPHFTEVSNTTINYGALNVKNA